MENLFLLLQLASSSLPVGAYCYSEGIETLVEQGVIDDEVTLKQWLQDVLEWGNIQIETAVMIRAYRSLERGNLQELKHWNEWISAAKETEELRQQSWQMGRILIKLLENTNSPLKLPLSFSLEAIQETCGSVYNFPIAFGITAVYWQIPLESATLGYLYSWLSNLVNGGVKLIPLGQTSGQQILLDLSTAIFLSTQKVLGLEDEELHSCSWGLTLASMAHETQYTRLFRS